LSVTVTGSSAVGNGGSTVMICAWINTAVNIKTAIVKNLFMIIDFMKGLTGIKLQKIM